MKNLRNFLALIALLSCGVSAFAQQYAEDSGGAVGSICEVGQPCPAPGMGDGGGAIDPSPYDPQPGYPQPGHGGYHQPNQPGNHGRADHREVYIGQYVRDGNLNLMRLLNLQTARGSSLRTVTVTLRPGTGSANFSLISDGYVEDTASSYSSFVTLQARRDLVIGQVRNLLLGIRGQVFVERIAADLDSGYNPYPGPNPYPPGPNPGPYPPGNGGEVVLPGYIGQTFYGYGNVDILQATNARMYPGYRVVAVTVYGQSSGNSNVQVMANGMILGQINLGYGGAQTVYPNMQLWIGQNVNAMNLLVNGQTRIDKVELRLRRY